MQKRQRAKSQPGAFTLLELMIVVGVVGLLLALLLPMGPRAKGKAERIHCICNLKQMGLSFRIWGGDNGDKYPMSVSVTNGGTLERIESGLVWPHFSVMSNELATPKIICCPADTERTEAGNWTGLSDTNVSYFVCLEADETNPQLWLAGDRNITNQFKPVRGILSVPTNSLIGWTDKIHRFEGNLALADGSVQQLSSSRLRESLRSITNASFRLAMPY